MAYKVKYLGIPTLEGLVRLRPEHKEAYLAAVRRFAESNKTRKSEDEVEITIAWKTKANTRPEQKYFRGVIVKDIAQEIGESEEMAFEIIQAKFFEYEDALGRKYIRSTALGEWTTTEWEEKMSEIRQWALDFLNLRILLPNEVDL
jgi:hypothetical protein